MSLHTGDRDQFIPSSPSDDEYEDVHTPVSLPFHRSLPHLSDQTLQNPDHAAVVAAKKRKKYWRMVGGMFCIFVAVATWVFMAEFVQSIQGAYNHVFFMRFAVNAVYSIMVIPYWLVRCLRERKERKIQRILHGRMPVASEIDPSPDTSLLNSPEIERAPNPALMSRTTQEPQHPLWRRLLFAGVIASQGSILGGWSWYVSLAHTDAAVNSTLYQSQVVFAFIFSVLLLGEKVKGRKVVAVFVALGGVAMISFSKQKGGSSKTEVQTTPLGIVITLISASVFAFYEVITKYFGKAHFHPDHKVEDTLMFQAMVGVMGTLTSWPYFLLFDHLKLEPFAMPATLSQWMGIGVIAGMDTIYTLAFLTGITLIGPVPVALGQLLAIPATFLADFALGRISGISAMAIIGCILVVSGFVLMEVKLKKKRSGKDSVHKSALDGESRHPYYAGMNDEFLFVEESDSSGSD